FSIITTPAPAADDVDRGGGHRGVSQATRPGQGAGRGGGRNRTGNRRPESLPRQLRGADPGPLDPGRRRRGRRPGRRIRPARRLIAGVSPGDYEAELADLVHRLRRNGATRVLVANTPDLDRLPAYLRCRTSRDD